MSIIQSQTTDTAYVTETLVLLERREEYSGVFTYIFRPSRPVAFTAGQYAHIRVPSLPEDIRRVREFSFASSPQDNDLWFGVDGRSGSEYQQGLQLLKPGEIVELFKIRGHVTWLPPVPQIVMIAGGVGATPFRSILRDVRQRNLPVTSTLIQVASGEFLYAEELEILADEHVAINRSLLIETLEHTANTKPEAHYYIAGSPDFVKTVAETLALNGITRIESDEFKGLTLE